LLKLDIFSEILDKFINSFDKSRGGVWPGISGKSESLVYGANQYFFSYQEKNLTQKYNYTKCQPLSFSYQEKT
jgi:hypothetical protein